MADRPDADAPSQQPHQASSPCPHQRARIDKKRLDEVFGDTLPSITDDEREPGEHAGFDADFYRRNRPPHHTA